ncbi:ARM repeat-containing protein [Ceratobasidium sp. AG-Ba]|nr:ARM repeat-containing protein [Ceratobasidium sp. AG-Ba]
MRRNSSSPTGVQEGTAILNASAKSVSATQMSSRQSVCSLGGKAIGLGDVASLAQEQNGSSFNMKRLSGAYNTPVSFNSLQGGEENYVGNMNGEMAASPGFGSYEYAGVLVTVPNVVRRHYISTMALVMDSDWATACSWQENNNKMGGLHDTKHKRGDIDREFNRFAGTRLRD